MTKSGAGTLVLSGNNSYTGATNLQQGTLILQGGNAIGDTSTVTMSDDQNVTLQLQANETIGALAGGNASGLFAATVAIGTNTLTVQQTSNQTYAGLLTGSGTLVKTGNYNLALSNVNSGFTGAVILTAGTAGTGYFGMSGSGHHRGHIDHAEQRDFAVSRQLRHDSQRLSHP